MTKENASEIAFFDISKNRNRRLVDYYWDTYKIDIKYKKLPCLILSKTKTNYVPIELCMIIEGQVIPKEKLPRGGSDVLKNMALVSPRRRMDAILDMVKAEHGPCR